MAYTLCFLGFVAGWLFRPNTTEAAHSPLIKHKYLVLLLVIEVSQMLTALSKSWSVEVHFDITMPLIFAYWLKGPLLYFYCRDLLGQPISLRAAWHLLPFAVLTLTAQWHSASYQLIEDHAWWQTVDLSASSQGGLTMAWTVATLAVLGSYCFASARQMKKLPFKQTSNIDLAWMKAACYSQVFVIFIASVLYLLLPAMSQWLPVSITLSEGLTVTTLATLCVMAMNQLGLVSRKNTEPEQEPTAACLADDKTAEEESIALFRLIQQTIAEQQLYTNPELRQSDVAKAVGLPTSQVSNIVNHCSDGNYSELIHHYRVHHAQQMIEQLTAREDSFTFNQVAVSSGYKSRSGFYTQYKRIYGITPGDYHKQLTARST